MSRIILTLAYIFVPFGHASAQVAVKAKSEFYPLELGHRWSYRFSDKDLPALRNAKDIVIEVEREENVVFKEPAKEGKDIDRAYVGYILKHTNGDKVSRDQVVVIDKSVQRLAVAGAKLTPPQVLFQPVQKWESDSVGRLGKVHGVSTVKPDTITIGERNMPTYLVAFRSHKTDDEKVEVDTWYAKDVGMVKQTIRARNIDRTLELRDLRDAKGTVLFSTEKK